MFNYIIVAVLSYLLGIFSIIIFSIMKVSSECSRKEETKSGDIHVHLAIIDSKRYKDFLALSECVSNGRIQMYRAKCFVELGELEKAKAILSSNLVIPDIREGEYSISAIWLELYRRIIASDEGREYEKITEKEVLEKYPIPYKLDFRMH